MSTLYNKNMKEYPAYNLTMLDEKNKKTSVVFCVPGNSFSPGFFASWTKLLHFMHLNPNVIEPHYINYYSPNIYNLRNQMLGGKSDGGKFQTPCEEDYKLDYIFLIDSDMVFDPMQVFRMIYKMEKYKLDAMIAPYYMGDGKTLTVIKDDSEKTLIEKGQFKYFSFQELQTIGKLNENMADVSNGGFGFACIAARCFEKIEYPWFEPMKYESPELTGFFNDDISFFKKFKKAGFNLACDTSIMIGHDKTVTL